VNHISNYHFISYSSVDALDFAFQLYDSLLAGPPSIPVWLDKRELKAGQDWDKLIVESIRICDSMIFVMTYDSVEDEDATLSDIKDEFVGEVATLVDEAS